MFKKRTMLAARLYWNLHGAQPMSTSSRETLLSRYRYDPLDRLVDCTPFKQAAIQRHYCKARLATDIQGEVQRSIVQHEDQLLAQKQCEGLEAATTLLATDQQRSVLNAIDADQLHSIAYTPHGHRPPENGLLSLLGFNGERPDPVTGHYHLGNGYRQFNPVLMRFNSPDSSSPFGEGGFNAYAYCENDPINHADPSGKAKLHLILRRIFNQPDVSGALSQVKKNLGSVKKVKAVATPTPKKTAPPRPPNTHKANAPATNRSPIVRASTGKKPSTPAHKTMDASKASIAQSRTEIAPISNFAAADEWDVQLVLRPLQPIKNYALPGNWGVLLDPDPMQPTVRLIRTEV
jgi:RHS repeat-associated protein